MTVGTTLFDQLIHHVLSKEFVTAACYHGYSKLVVQYGKGTLPNIGEFQWDETDENGTRSGIFQSSSSSSVSLSWEVYRFKSSLRDDMTNADLIISHAGAGSIMEGMEQCRSRMFEKDPEKGMKILVVVVNAALMDNHQSELAEALERRGYLLMLRDPNHLVGNESIFEKIKTFEPQCFMGGDDSAFGTILNTFIGNIDDKKRQ